MAYSGHYCPNERFADNRDFYQEVIDGAFVQGLSVKEARRALTLLERFPPEVPHSRLVGQIVQVFSTKRPQFRNLQRAKIFEGGEKVYSIDFGKEMSKIVKRKEVGDRVPIENPHFEFTYDNSMWSRHSIWGYDLRMSGKFMTSQEPKRFVVLTYTKIDDVLVSVVRDILKPKFSHKFAGFQRSRKKFDFAEEELIELFRTLSGENDFPLFLR